MENHSSYQELEKFKTTQKDNQDAKTEMTKMLDLTQILNQP